MLVTGDIYYITAQGSQLFTKGEKKNDETHISVTNLDVEILILSLVLQNLIQHSLSANLNDYKNQLYWFQLTLLTIQGIR